MDKRKVIILTLGSFTLLAVIALVVIFFVMPNMQNGDDETPVDPFGNSGEDRTGGLVDENTLPQTGDSDPQEAGGKKIELKDGSILRRISAEPVAGAVAYVSEGEPVVRYTLRDTGDIYETPIARVTLPTVLHDVESPRGVAYALWSPTASTTVSLSLSTNNESVFSYIYLFTQPQGSSSTASLSEPVVSGRIGLQDPLSSAFSPDGTMLAVLVAEEKGSTLYVERVDSGNRRQVWSSPLRGLTLRWASPQQITVYTNPDDDLTGAVWSVDPANGASRLLMSGKDALGVLPHPTKNLMLYSQHSEAGIYSLRVFHADGKEDTYLSSPTIAEKCAWDTIGSYVYCAIPKNMNREGFVGEWYRGEFASNDTLWRYDAETGAGKRLLDPEELSGISIDMVDLDVDPTGSYLLFRDRVIGHLWSLELPMDAPATNNEVSGSTTTAPGF